MRMKIPTGISRFYIMIRKRENGMEKLIKRLKGLGFAAAALCMIGTAGAQVHAADGNMVGILYEVTADTEIKEEAAADSAVIGRLQAGTAVIVESDDGTWSRVLYQGLEGYVESDMLEVYAEEELANLEQEMGDVAAEEQRLIEEAELAAKQKRTSLIWGIVGAVLVLAIFGVGVVSTFRNTKKEEELQDGESVSDKDGSRDE